MNSRKDTLISVLFMAFLIIIMLLFSLQNPKTFSEKEKRNLAEAPQFSSGSLLGGSFGDEAEKWAADHLPARDFFIGVSAYADLLLNLQVTKDIYIGKDGRLFERPAEYRPEIIRRNMDTLNRFAETANREIDFMLVPSSGYLMSDSITGLSDPYYDKEILESACAEASDKVHPFDLLSLFSNTGDTSSLFYRTDHHWTSLGAYKAYAFYGKEKGKQVPEKKDYRIVSADGFYGSTYARGCLWNIPSETIELWQGRGTYTVTFSEKNGSFDHLFFPEHLEEADKYPVWLDGNHPLVHIVNHAENAEGSLLVIRDSFANCMGCFLADSYREVTLVDLRYYKLPVSDLLQQHEFDDILFLYSVGNFMSDSNIVWLQ